ncbi:MAG: two-component regulator propeller domain-containing protein [Acidobacteriota bacterium]|nr:two-component regulator propeller domain-containing protein [Acidobacteriota bacterium]
MFSRGRYKILACWLAFLGLAGAHGVRAGEEVASHFERIGTKGGPPPDVITTVYQDSTGFVWIGARDGLTRFDGHSFVVFEHDPADPRSISDNAIRTVYEDSGGDLWIGTNTGGLNRLDRATWEFEHFRHDSGDPASLSHDSVYAIAEDSDGTLWVGTQKGLNRFDPKTRTFRQFLADPGRPGSLAHDYVITIYEDRGGRVWVGTLGGGLNCWQPETKDFTVFRHDPTDPSTINDDSALAIAEDFRGGLWIGTASGLSRMDRSTGTFSHFQPEASGLSDALVTSLAAGIDDTLWIGTYNGGLNELDLATGEFRIHRHDAMRPDSLGDDRVVSLATDNTGAVWVGTWGGGLNRLSPTSQLFAALTAPPPDGVDDDDVTSLGRDRAGGVWIGTRSGDLVRLDSRTGSFRSYLQGGLDGTPRIILGVIERRDGSIWVATNGGLLRVDPPSGKIREWHHDPGDPTSIGPGYVRALFEDPRGGLWVGTGEGGLHRVDRDGRVVERFVHDAEDPESLSDNYVTALHEDAMGTLWVGTRSGGLNAFDPGTGKARHYRPDPASETAIGHHYVTAIHEDSMGRLWVATGGGGLNQVVDREGPGPIRFVRFTATDGLIDDDVMAIAEDDDGSLWLSTKRGLSRFDPDEVTFANFNVADGLPSGEFESGAVVRTDDTILFGSVNWLVGIATGTDFPESTPSPTVITSIRTAAGEVRGDRPAWELDHFEIPYGEWFSIDLAVLDYHASHNHSYLYRLGDKHDEWIDLGGRRAITFTDLAPGEHLFRVRGRNCRGVWSEASPALAIEVIPPFWMTTWFRASLGLAVVGMAIVGHRVRTAALQRRNRELEHLHEQREKARQQLAEAYQRLRLLTRRLEAAKEDERRRIARELHDEMGPALTAVIINLQLLSKDDPQKTIQRIDDTVELVDRMVQRIRDLSLDIRPPLLDALGLLPALKGYLEAQAERSGIDIEVLGDTAVHGLAPELEITAFRVSQEAVTNVIRHANASRATVTVKRVGAELEITIEDDGGGFEVQDALDRAAVGKALGLLGIQERIGMIGGQVDIVSAPGHGTTIRVRMPLEAAA